MPGGQIVYSSLHAYLCTHTNRYILNTLMTHAMAVARSITKFHVLHYFSSTRLAD